jgi:hypothetical protein
MKPLGTLQTTVWERIKDAQQTGNGIAAQLLGQIAGEMDLNYDRWKSLLDGGSPNGGSSGGSPPIPNTAAPQAAESEDYSGRNIRGFEFDGTKVPVRDYKQLLLLLIRALQERHRERFDALALQIGGNKPYFSASSADLRSPHKLPEGKLFVETNLNNNLKVTICFRLVRAFGHPAESLKLDVEPFRTRAIRTR